MDSIAIDYWKCISIIESCKTIKQALSCDNLIKAFETKHRKRSKSWSKYKELMAHISLKISMIYQKN